MSTGLQKFISMDLQAKRLQSFGHGERSGQNTNTEKGSKKKGDIWNDPQRTTSTRKRSGKKSKRNSYGKMEGSGIFFVHRAVQKQKCIRNKSKTTMLSLKKISNDGRGEVVSSQALCSTGNCFKSGPEFRLPRLRISYGFLQCLQLNGRIVSLILS